jgi:hypothetical protein
MLYEYALISVVNASGYWGYYFLRNSPNGTPLFGVMQVTAPCSDSAPRTRVRSRRVRCPGAIGIGAGASCS